MTKVIPASGSERQIVNIDVVNPFVPPGVYREGLQIALNKVSPYLNQQQVAALIGEKLMLENEGAQQERYIQAASELTVCAWFAFRAPKTFIYEPKLKPPKDVDCAFKIEDMQFNIEVKCANYESQREIYSNSDLRMSAFGRLDQFFETVDEFKSLLGAGSEPSRLEHTKHMDLKLKDYLLSAQSKFAEHVNLNHLNVLVVCVDDQMDMNQWVGYLYGPRGLFTTESFEPPENYNKVDLVVLTNLYHRHYQPLQKNKISQHWNMGEAFNVLIRNPISSKPDRVFDYFSHYLPNETNALIDHVAEGDSPDFMKMALAIPDYVGHKQLAKGIYRFQGGYPINVSDEE